MAESGSTTYIPLEIKKTPSHPFLRENNFTLLRSSKSDTKRMRGPRRVLRLCMFALLLPALLITIPLYMRMVLYPPSQYPMMPTDQRLLSRHVSSVWCQAQLTRMNGSFTAFLAPETPHILNSPRVHAMIHSIALGDDVKEYWGFHLLKGSKVTVSACSRYDGAQLMILRGVENLRRCAWIGEEDSREEDDDLENEEVSENKEGIKEEEGVLEEMEKEIEESNQEHEMNAEEANVNGLPMPEKKIPESAEQEIVEEVQQDPTNHSEQTNGDKADEILQASLDETHPREQVDTSEERRQDLQHLLRQALSMSKDKKEILRILHSVGRERDQPLPQRIQQILGVTPTSSPSRRRKFQPQLSLLRQERAIGMEDDDNAHEVFDEEEPTRPTKVAVKRPSENIEKIVGGQIFLPEGLNFERGKFNQTTPNDGSDEENVSSYSSSEEALASCDGVIMSLPLVSYRGCNIRWTEINKFTYDIPVTGTYYFVFSSENEINENKLFFNITFERMIYDTTRSATVCENKTECLVPLSFWSNDRAVVEVPEESTWDHSYVMDTTCEPRVAVYLTFILLVPFVILLCAFQ
ncbi:uncharacterized protein LOC125033435 isoform X2 [Penaeus chinensis]|uniref:uncharacterized protein LOC125033435 isoform X2 n=1 Tax=Penaeus chinensis TaxID=139456 RepID=UPI001FB675CB|nr:uncharacterized protein LOC125033435 isoform X2 [Penaeus chinensis]